MCMKRWWWVKLEYGSFFLQWNDLKFKNGFLGCLFFELKEIENLSDVMLLYYGKNLYNDFEIKIYGCVK